MSTIEKRQILTPIEAVLKAQELLESQVIPGEESLGTYDDLEVVKTYEYLGKIRLFVIGNEEGFVILSSDAENPEVLMLSTGGAFDLNDIPPSFENWIASYIEEVRWFEEKGYLLQELNSDKEEAQGSSNRALRANTSSGISVGPLLDVHWGLLKPYNLNLVLGGARCYVGCSNVAVGQIMYYWGVQGVKRGSDDTIYKYKRGCAPTYAYETEELGYSVPALPAIQQFDYDNLLTKYSNNGVTELPDLTTEQKNAVAQLLEYIGKASYANYTHSGTGTWPSLTFEAMLGNLRLGSNMRILEIKNEDDEAKIKEEILNKRPVWLCANGYGTIDQTDGTTTRSDISHAFLVDGYREVTKSGETIELYHFNFGWYGKWDAWSTLSTITSSKYNKRVYTFKGTKTAIINIDPEYSVYDINNDRYINIMDVTLILNLLYRVLRRSSYRRNIGGTEFIGPNGNVLFFPYCNYKTGKTVNRNIYGYYWLGNCSSVYSTRGLVFTVGGNYNTLEVKSLDKYVGASIKPVYIGDTPEEDGAISLGYKWGKNRKETYWAVDNLGTTSEDADKIVGKYYAWGEISSKDTFYKKDYNFADLGNQIAGTAYDPATLILGPKWRLPMREEIDALIDNCIKFNGAMDVNFDNRVTVEDAQTIIDIILGRNREVYY